MDNSKLIVLAIVLLAAVGGAFVILTHNGDNGGDNGSDDSASGQDDDYSDVVVDMAAINNGITDRVHIYGNADNNDVIDAEDVKFVKYMAAGKETWNQEKFRYADANNDGKVDKADVAYLENIISKTADTKMYYEDNWGNVSFAYYPLSTTGNVGTMYWEGAGLAVLLGIWEDRVKACGNGSLDEVTYPGFSAKFSYGKGYNVAPEVVLKSNLPENGAVANIIAYPWGDGTAKDIIAAVQGAGLEFNVLAPSNKNDISYVLTMGVLLGVEERAHKYVDTVEGNIRYVQEATKDISADKAPKVMSIMVKSKDDKTTMGLLGEPATSSANGLFKYIQYTPAQQIKPDEAKYQIDVTAEWIIAQDPDYILYCSSGCWNTNTDDAGIQKQAEDVAKELFSGTRAYQEGHVICTINGTMGSYMAGFAFPELVQTIFPDQIDKTFADNQFNSWFEDNWVSYGVEDKPGYKIRVVGGAA